MGFSLDEYRSNTGHRTVTVKPKRAPEQTIEVTFDSSQYDVNLVRSLRGEIADGTANELAQVEFGIGLAAKLIVDWDIESGGKKLPVTADSLASLPLDIFTDIVEAITEDQNPGND